MAVEESKETDNNKNSFYCNECQSFHSITDLFLWSRCQHKYGRGCVVFSIKQQLYDGKLPVCIVDNCNKLLLDEEASLVLPEDVLNNFYQTHMEYQIPQQCIIKQDIKIDDDEKKQSNGSITDNYSSVVFSAIDYDPSDNSSSDDDGRIIAFHKNEEYQPLLNHNNINMDNKPQQLSFECVICNEEHPNDFKFEWSQCKHVYNRQCAENLIISFLFQQQIPQCTKCKQPLHRNEAETILPLDEMQVLNEIYALKQSMDSFNAKNILAQIEEKEEEEEELMPSVLVLPDNNINALLPIDDDFDDDNGMRLNVAKEQQLQKQNLFYCVCCKELISLLENEDNPKFVALKCGHISCRECAIKHTKHEMETLQIIPSCPVCPISITDLDLIEIYGRSEAKKLMDALFKCKSLKVPPFRPVPAMDEPLLTAGNIENDRDDDDAVVDAEVISKKEEENMLEKVEEKSQNDDDEDMAHCLTESCHKKGFLSKDEKNRLDCDGCGISWCVSCGVPWHLGQTCQQYRTEIENQNLLMALQQQEQMQFGGYDQMEMQFQNLYVDQGWKTCPVCLSVVEKNGGCNHITCACSAHWCWICGCIVDENDLGKHYDIGKCQLNEQMDDDDLGDGVRNNLNAGHVL